MEYDGKDKNRLILNSYKLLPDGNQTKYGLSYMAGFGYMKDIYVLQNTGGLYFVPMSVQTIKGIDKWPDSQVVWQSINLKTRAWELLQEEKSLRRLAQVQLDWRDKGVFNHEVVEHDRYPLKEYQKVGAYLSQSSSGFALFMEQGTGKTPTTISRMCHHAQNFHENRPAHYLVVCPPALKLNWEKELRTFSTLPYHCHIVKGTGAQRTLNLMQALADVRNNDSKFLVVIVPYDTLVSSEELFMMIDWDITVLDESQSIKDPKTSRWKTCKKIREKSKNRVILSGTPIGNSVLDLYTQLEFLGEGVTGCPSEKVFKSRFAVTKDIGHGVDMVLSSKNDDQLKEIIAQRCFVVKKKDVLKDLPDKVYEYYETEMTEEQKKHYKQMATTLVAELEGIDTSSASEVNHILTQLLRLAQITAGFLVIPEVRDEWDNIVSERQEYVYSKNPKVDALIEMAKELPQNEKMIIWNHWKPLIPIVMDRFEQEGFDIALYRGTNKQKDDAVEKFTYDRNCRFFFANPRSAGAGLNLLGYPPREPEKYDTNTTEMVYLSYDWSYLARAQSEDRAHRTGTRTQLRIRSLVVDATIDMEIQLALEAKKELANDFTSVKGLMEKLLLLK